MTLIQAAPVPISRALFWGQTLNFSRWSQRPKI